MVPCASHIMVDIANLNFIFYILCLIIVYCEKLFITCNKLIQEIYPWKNSSVDKFCNSFQTPYNFFPNTLNA